MLEKIRDFKSKEEALNALLSDFFIIQDLTDNDLYKFTMQQYAFHNQPKSIVKYKFKCRSAVNLSRMVDVVRHQINHYCNLTFSERNINKLRSIDGFQEDYLDFLKNLKHNQDDVKVFIDEDNQLAIEIEGLWTHTILMEVPFLAIINGVNSILEAADNGGVHKFVKLGIEKLKDKIALIKDSGSNMKFVEFGTRRRFHSLEYQLLLNKILLEECPDNYLGVSNILISDELGVKVYGTMAHEYLQAAQAIIRPEDSQVFAFNDWLREYDGKFAVALSDIFGNEAFFYDFHKELAENYTGLRQDSGDPKEWGRMAIDFYHHHSIDPKTKTIMFSDGLNIPKAIALDNMFSNEIDVISCIGTNITNDTGIKALSIVIKMTYFNNKPVAKVSNDISKSMCQEPKYSERLLEIIDEKKKRYNSIFAA